MVILLFVVCLFSGEVFIVLYCVVRGGGQGGEQGGGFTWNRGGNGSKGLEIGVGEAG